MFLGGYTNAMDDKGRVNIPADFREVLRRSYDDERLVLSRDLLDDCLRGYPMQEWQEWLQKLRALPTSHHAVRRIHRRVVSSAVVLSPDKQGRVLISASLRQITQMNKSVHFAGTNQTFEIWDVDLWRQETELANSDDFDPGLLSELGL